MPSRASRPFAREKGAIFLSLNKRIAKTVGPPSSEKAWRTANAGKGSHLFPLFGVQESFGRHPVFFYPPPCGGFVWAGEPGRGVGKPKEGVNQTAKTASDQTPARRARLRRCRRRSPPKASPG